MYRKEHGIAHFHALYGEYEAAISVLDLQVLRGRLPTRAMNLVREWARAHQSELLDNWQRARGAEPLQRIEPLR
jgi:hypothetical protein